MKTMIVVIVILLTFVTHVSHEHPIIINAECTKEIQVYEYIELRKNTRATVYHSDPKQCGSDFMTTADGSKIDTANAHKLRWCAVSRDWLKGYVKMGDTIHINSPFPDIAGEWIIKDKMGKYYWRPLREKELEKLDSLDFDMNEYKYVNDRLCVKETQVNWIDFLSHPRKGIMGKWNRGDMVVMKKVKVKKTVLCK